MDESILSVIVLPIVARTALFTGIALPFSARRRSRRSPAERRPARPNVLRRISAAGRKARAAKPDAHDSALGDYLYVPCTRSRYHHGNLPQTRRWVQAVPIVRKTAKLIYYASDSWDRAEAVVSPGCISRRQFETDTRCPDNCRADIRGMGRARRGATREHWPPGQDRCHHGYPAGVIPIPGNRHRPGPAGHLFFASRRAAEQELSRAERGRAERGAREAPLVRQLRRAMVGAHPDRGGTAEQFIEAHRRYQMALQLAQQPESDSR